MGGKGEAMGQEGGGGCVNSGVSEEGMQEEKAPMRRQGSQQAGPPLPGRRLQGWSWA